MIDKYVFAAAVLMFRHVPALTWTFVQTEQIVPQLVFHQASSRAVADGNTPASRLNQQPHVLNLDRAQKALHFLLILSIINSRGPAKPVLRFSFLRLASPWPKTPHVYAVDQSKLYTNLIMLIHHRFRPNSREVQSGNRNQGVSCIESRASPG